MSSSTLIHQPDQIPSNLFKPAAPLKATCIENTRLCADGSLNDVRHLVFKYDGGQYWYLDGQSAGILPPGHDESGNRHKLRLYSIASPSKGDDGSGHQLSLCVKRLVYTDENGQEKRGVCSNFLCDLSVGDEVEMTGPVGKGFLMPEAKDATMIMMATGTGIAPFRAFLHTRYTDRVNESGQTVMIFGAQTQKDYLYKETLEAYRQHDSYDLITAFSREQTTAEGKKMYIQERVREQADRFLALLEQPNTYVYICGLRGMESGILEALEQASAAQGKNWPALFEDVKAQKRWRVEVY